MGNEKKKGKIEEEAEKAGEAVGKIAKKSWGVVKSFGKGVKKELDKKDEETK